MNVAPFLVAAAVGLSVVSAPGTAVAAEPAGPNPYLSWPANSSTVDLAAWRKIMVKESSTRRSTVDNSAPVVTETEPAGVRGANDTPAQAEPLPRFGTGAHRTPVARILGGLSPSADAQDVDVYRLDLRAGDVFAAMATGAARQVTILDPAGVRRQGSAQDFSALYPEASPLPRGGNAIADHVAAVTGTHYLAVAGDAGDYEVDLQVHRPPLERERTPQTVFLDFDGATVDLARFEIEPNPGVRTLSPFSSFLGQWGLSQADERAVARQIVRTVRENLAADTGGRLVVLSSLDHRDVFGRENVSRVVIGGTTEEAGFATVGIAESIDPGNFAHEETALVLQDFLAQPAGPVVSINTYLTPESDRVAFVGTAIGNVVAHEIGHYVGSWHTDNTNTELNLMDAGGAGIADFFGVGPDGVGGTADDTDTDLGTDVFRPLEGFTGLEDTVTRTAYGLS
ncbi:hypothetical protein [Actinophytocola oryzae]|uniref:hypothetical protein n=1 Tax=Actinophytocola oryzae TaxID=502181 RepID=UPI001063A092|nr:hypothetical protein [Actinophytocola oryzae]